MRGYFAVAAIGLLVSTGYALAKDRGYNNPPEIREWFKSLQRPDVPGPIGNRSCCDASDCHRTEFTLNDGHYRARLGRIVSDTRPPVWELTEWVDIPDSRVIKDKGNPVGEAIICHAEITAARQIPAIYCFVPGNLS